MGRLSELCNYLNGNGKKPEFEYVSVSFDNDGKMYFRVYYNYYTYYDVPYKNDYVFKLFENPKSIAAVILLHRLCK